ncbi:UDP-N-acetylglucosamine 2-epimerase [Rosistilla oblonga]|uniref:non-hydrolyzing UDP-N-acetylglucosamine 2-epimerase n=1 Tax=Rosistilla oblonga TaxID=2527990 RepID=UPI00118A52F8|nr:UDP-N-acetylglucosamine 2-epimerase (non-hydrolyzing) [Rosistilla oblonga]QDV12558.1 UDP-N-acetylglucosamine 2-epimerase [Rosistilla oblonga]
MTDHIRPLIVFGTRPEAIKMAPIVSECYRRNETLAPIVCLTGQHREMVDQVVSYFGISVDSNLDLMSTNQTLASLTSRCIEGIDALISKYTPNCIVIQGDTTTVMATAIAAFYRSIKVVHVEAGLRTGNIHSPWPEEFNRRIASLATTIHCAPTVRAERSLLAEGIPKSQVHVTGNTVVDALLQTVERERLNSSIWDEKYSMIGDRRMVLVTAHRRESFGDGMESICNAIFAISRDFPECEFIFPVHLNPNVQEPVNRIIGASPNVHLVAPATYPEFVWLMDRCDFVLTDSGGVQEEAPSLEKEVLVMRETTERPEAVESGLARLIGTSARAIISESSRLLKRTRGAHQVAPATNPYGDGKAASRIVDLIARCC